MEKEQNLRVTPEVMNITTNQEDPPHIMEIDNRNSSNEVQAEQEQQEEEEEQEEEEQEEEEEEQEVEQQTDKLYPAELNEQNHFYFQCILGYIHRKHIYIPHRDTPSSIVDTYFALIQYILYFGQEKLSQYPRPERFAEEMLTFSESCPGTTIL